MQHHTPSFYIYSNDAEYGGMGMHNSVPDTLVHMIDKGLSFQYPDNLTSHNGHQAGRIILWRFAPGMF